MRSLRTVLRIAGATALAVALTTALVGAPAAATTTVKATADVNVRSGPSTKTSVLGVLRTGQTAVSTATGKDWTTIRYAGRTGYVSTRYVSVVRQPTKPAAPVVAGAVRTTTGSVNLRKGPGTSYGVITVLRTNTKVTLTGGSGGGFAEVYAGTRRGWVSLAYLKTSTAVPAVIGRRYATTDLLVRTTAGSSYKVVGTIKSGGSVSITGVVSNGRAQIVYAGAARWVTAKYLRTAKTTSPAPTYGVEKGLAPNAIKVHRAAMAAFPQITTYYGVVSGSDGDHSTGHALDIMIPNYKSVAGRALGKRIADWARSNAKSLGVHYVIWDQKIWNIQRDKEGWRAMSNRGSDSANHKNHVHVSVY